MFSKKLIDKFKSADKIVVSTGAGFSAESGVPTFRGEDGLWKKYRAEELATPTAFASDPHLVLEWYDWRRKKIKTIDPNPGYYAVVEMEKKKKVVVITQNVDGLHQRAGSSDIISLHGDITIDICNECRKPYPAREYDPKTHPLKCGCGGPLRPGVVWFGESLPESALSRAFSVASTATFFISAGTSGMVQPAASLPMIAKQSGAFVVEVNRERTVLSPEMDEVLIGKSGEILPEMAALLEN